MFGNFFVAIFAFWIRSTFYMWILVKDVSNNAYPCDSSPTSLILMRIQTHTTKCFIYIFFTFLLLILKLGLRFDTGYNSARFFTSLIRIQEVFHNLDPNPKHGCKPMVRSGSETLAQTNGRIRNRTGFKIKIRIR